MINDIQTLPSKQLSSSRESSSSNAEMAQIIDHRQEGIVKCNADSGSPITAQGMYSTVSSILSSSVASLLNSIFHV